MVFIGIKLDILKVVRAAYKAIIQAIGRGQDLSN